MKITNSQISHFQIELEMLKTIDDYCLTASSKGATSDLAAKIQPIVSHLHQIALSNVWERIIKFVSKLPLFSTTFKDKLNNLINTNNEIKKLLKIHKKVTVLFETGNDIDINNTERLAIPTMRLLALKIKSIKYGKAVNHLHHLPEILTAGKEREIQEVYEVLPNKVKRSLEGLLQMAGFDAHHKTTTDVLKLLPELTQYKDASGKNIFVQMAELLEEKKAYSEDLIILESHLSSHPLRTSSSDSINAFGNNLVSPHLYLTIHDQIINDDIKIKLQEAELSPRRMNEIIGYAEGKIDGINSVFRKLIDKIDINLSIFEASAERLAEKFGNKILEKPISITMCGVEYQGFIKEGGLAEAIEGMAQGLLKQHPENKVRLIFPKFSILPKQIMDQLEKKPRIVHKSQNGNIFTSITIVVNGVECFFIEHPQFEITSKERSIYSGSHEEMKERFVIFSSLAADLIGELPKTDIIHLHDWHVAGVELKLRNQKKEIAPIVFSYHNNQRGAQGRYFVEQYNYEPVIQGLKEAGIASQNINLMVDVVKKADAVTTVSTSFAVESQSLKMGEGISFAMREAAKEGKLQGIVNGTNVDRWNPHTDASLKNWTSLITHNPLDLTYDVNSDDILLKKELAKVEFQAWIKSNFPEKTFDDTKPLITFIGRYDYYQKGLDKFEEAIKTVLENGAQIVFMGTGSLMHEDLNKGIPAAPIIQKIFKSHYNEKNSFFTIARKLNQDKITPPNGQVSWNSKTVRKIIENEELLLYKLQEKYPSGVLVLQDFKTEEGRLHYQQGSTQKPGIGSIVRAATDIVFLPSRFEPCGLVQFEAWLFGSLVIASNVGGFKDTVQLSDSPDFNGYLFDRDVKKNDPSSLASVVKQAIDDFRNENRDSKKTRIKRTMTRAKKNGWDASPSGYTPVEKYRFVYENAREAANARLSKMASHPLNLSQYRRILHVFSEMEKNQISLEESYLEAFYSKNFSKIKVLYKQLPPFIKKQMPSPYLLNVNHLEYEKMGAFYSEQETKFAVHVPHAQHVSLLTYDTEGFQHKVPMHKDQNGLWSAAVEGLPCHTPYQYLIDGYAKIDPYGLYTTPVHKAGQVPKSMVVDRNFLWDDSAWIQKRTKADTNQPLTIYELHPASWKTQDGTYMNYREIAKKLVQHCKMTGYTHVELMGILEHPNESSQGYQVTNYFSPNSRMGSVADFKYMINYLHNHNIGAILDWIPNHFAIEDYALTNFDGTNQFESGKASLLFSLRGLFIYKWGVKAFNFRKKHVRDFLISSAIYWLKEMHIDCLRIDAIRPILSSEHPKSAHKFLRELNDTIHHEFPGVLTIAEDYSGSLEATKATSLGGYGFDFKWNVGWVKNIVDYIKIPPKERPNYYNRLIQAIEGDMFHKMIMALSHDEIGSSALIDMTPGLTESQKCANVRSLFSLQMCLPGKKLFFMGSEVGSSLEWTQLLGRGKGLLNDPVVNGREKIQVTLRALSEIYKNNPGLWKKDDNAHDLNWIEKTDYENSFVAFRRILDEKSRLASFHNFSGDKPKKYKVKVDSENAKNFQCVELFNSNAQRFGGDGTYSNPSIQVKKDKDGAMSYIIFVPPLSAVVVRETTLMNQVV